MDSAVAGAAASMWSAPRSATRLSEALDDPDVTVVAVCTPPEEHAEQVRASLAAGKHVLVEKPAGVTADQVAQLAEVARRVNGPVAMVAENWLHSPVITRLRRLLDEGVVGETLSIVATLETGIDLASDPQRRRSRLINGGIHMLNVIRRLCGEPTHVSAFCLPDRVMADSGPEADTDVVVSFRFGGRAVGSLQLSGRAQRPRPGLRQVRVIGTAGMAEADPIAGWLEWSADAWSGGTLRRWDDHSGEVGQSAQITHFLAAVNGQAEPLPSLHDQVRTHRLIEAIQRSARELTTVEVAV